MKRLPVNDADETDDERVAARPFLKWAGGKWAIAPRLTELLPRDARTRPYREAFLGGGAMFFHLQPEEATLTDALRDLIHTYEAVRSNVEALIHRLEQLRKDHSTEHYYETRTRFNEEQTAAPIDRAAWLVYLNKTCFNGLFRTNKSGGFNVPEGRYKAPTIVDPPNLRLAGAVLSHATIACAPFDHLLDVARADELVYLDPPYVPTSKTASFAAYSEGAFGPDDQTRLAGVFRTLDARGCLLALSNSDTPLVRELYAGYDISPIIAPRAISSKAATRGDVSELLIRNLGRYPDAR